MKALTWHGKRDVRVDTVPDPTIEQATDAIVRVTSSGICGSDLHLYEVLGAVHRRGRHPRPRADGHRRGGRLRGHPHQAGRPGRDPVQHLLRPLLHVRPAACTRSARRRRCASRARARRCSATRKLYGQVPGGQAELLRVPQAQFGPIKVPEGPPDERFVYLSDVLPTAWQAVEYAAIPDGRHRRRLRARADRPDVLPDRPAPRRRPGDRRSTSCPSGSSWPAATASRPSTSPRQDDLGRRAARAHRRPRPRLRDRRGRHGGARRAGRQARPGRRRHCCPTRWRAS